MWGLFLCLLGAIGISPIPYFAGLVGTTEPALKIIISVVMSYPLAIYYHRYVQTRSSYSKNLYFIITGMDMAFYNFGLTMYHNMIPVIILFISTSTLGPGKENVILTFIVNMTYLLTGYVMTESEDYDITWTMPQCVLALKLIALSFDIWDGAKNTEELSSTNKKTALEQSPTFLELLGFVYFPSCFLIGPIFSFKRYHSFVTNQFPLEKDVDIYEKKAMAKMAQGILYLMAFRVGVSVFSMDFMLSDEFWETSIFYRHFYCGMWAHFALYKYISCWLLTEASCIRFGLSYNGTEKTADGQVKSKWDGCNNIKLVRFESATKFQHYIDSFNCNTNHFAAEYIYKRLKFLGDRNLSQFFTLLFLAVWHGTRSGYYVTFFNEFIIIFMEKGLESLLVKTDFYEKVWSNSVAKYIMYALLKTYTIVFMGWSLVPFDTKTIGKWWSIYTSLYFSGFLLFLPWAFVYKPILKKLFRSRNVDTVKTK